MERIEALFEELNYPGPDRLKKALRNRGIPFTKEQVEQLTKGETVRQLQQAAPPLKGKVASHYKDYEWQADLIDWTSAPSSSESKKKDPTTRDKFILIVQDVFPAFSGPKPLQPSSLPKCCRPLNASLKEQVYSYRQTDLQLMQVVSSML